MRKSRVIAAEAVSRVIADPSSYDTVIHEAFIEVQKGLEESRVLHPASEQVDFIFRESDDRWLSFCGKFEKNYTGLSINKDAFMQWANGENYEPLAVKV
jgi:hypothetical protein